MTTFAQAKSNAVQTANKTQLPCLILTPRDIVLGAEEYSGFSVRRVGHSQSLDQAFSAAKHDGWSIYEVIQPEANRSHKQFEAFLEDTELRLLHALKARLRFRLLDDAQALLEDTTWVDVKADLLTLSLMPEHPGTRGTRR